jgi:hypothetical protein
VVKGDRSNVPLLREVAEQRIKDRKRIALKIEFYFYEEPTDQDQPHVTKRRAEIDDEDEDNVQSIDISSTSSTYQVKRLAALTGKGRGAFNAKRWCYTL